ncbi:MAG TPA: heavy metal translocating P-type ATPase [Clostridiales bacterium]|nr:heavy metal translocating P-type ATPase [Clostridiales bacterium]
MEKEYDLQGLSCASCAAKIERHIGEQEGVVRASVNALNSTLKAEFKDEKAAEALDIVKKIVSKYEPNVKVSEKSAEGEHRHSHSHTHGHSHGGETTKAEILAIAFGSFVFVFALLSDHAFKLNFYVTLSLYVIAYLALGFKVLADAFKNILKGQIFDENFLMSLATLGAFATKNFAEAVAVMLFYRIGEYFQDAAVRRSKKSIAELIDIRPDYANLKRGEDFIEVHPSKVQVGDIILIKPGEKVPLDAVIVEGRSALDTSALTGENSPKDVEAGDTILSGTVNINGLIQAKVTKSFENSTAAKILDLVENASDKKAPTENFITKFSRYYTPAVVGLALMLALIPPLLLGGGWVNWLNRALIFLVVSCPCALVISIPLGFFGGIGAASKRGILIKGSNYLEALNSLETLVFDKTGTLTKGVFEIKSLHPEKGVSEEELLEYAAKAESFSNHPIALSVLKAYGKKVDKSGLTDYKELPGHGVSLLADGKRILAGNERLMVSEGIEFSENPLVGSKLYIALDNKYLGSILVGDSLKEDAPNALKALKNRGLKNIVMLTGDNEAAAKAVAESLDLDFYHAGLLPTDKVDRVADLKSKTSDKGKLAFVGDGINDAPVLAMADVGIAMGGLGSDAAIEAADIVLMTDELSKINEAIDIAAFTKKIVWQNIIFALGVKTIFLLLGTLGIAGMWEAVFADVGVSILAILNSIRVLRYKGA